MLILTLLSILGYGIKSDISAVREDATDLRKVQGKILTDVCELRTQVSQLASQVPQLAHRDRLDSTTSNANHTLRVKTPETSSSSENPNSGIPNMVVKKYYAVRVGRKPGVYGTWEECEEQTRRVKGADRMPRPSIGALAINC